MYGYAYLKKDITTIDIHKGTLLVGIGETNKYLYEAVQPESIEEAQEAFGDCELTTAFTLFFEAQVSQYVYVLNIENRHDYLNLVSLLKTFDFSYVIPVDIYLSDFYYDPLNDNRKTYYFRYLLREFSLDNHSVMLVTDSHASLYENIDDYLSDMSAKRDRFFSQKLTTERFEQLIFVANNLEQINYANVMLAIQILSSEVNEYPSNLVNKQAIFDIDPMDNVRDIAYYKTHQNKTTTVENLLNLYPEKTPIKIFTIFRVAQWIYKELTKLFSKFIGQKYTEYKKKLIGKECENFLRSVKNYVLIDFKILELYGVDNRYYLGTTDVIIRYAIWPIGCTEKYIARTVRVS